MHHRPQTGFTLVELIMVIILLGILAAVAVPRLPNVNLFQSQFDARQVVSSLSRLRAHALASQCYVVADFRGTELIAYIEDSTDEEIQKGDACAKALEDKTFSTPLNFISETDIRDLARDENGTDAFHIVFTPLGEAWFFFNGTWNQGDNLDIDNRELASQSFSHTSASRQIIVEGATGYARWE